MPAIGRHQWIAELALYHSSILTPLFLRFAQRSYGLSKPESSLKLQILVAHSAPNASLMDTKNKKNEAGYNQ